MAVQGLYFDTDKDSIKAVSQPVVAEIAKLLKSAPSLRLHVVGHTDNQGKADPDLNLSVTGAQAASSRNWTSKYGISPNRLDAFGCGIYSPVASNEAERGRARNRRVELVQW